MRAFLLLPALDHGDALSHFSVLVAEALRAMGIETAILAPIVHPKMRGHGRRAGRLPRGLRADDRLILVHSTASGWAGQLREAAAPALLLYTGITPPALCEPFAAHLAPGLHAARAQAAALAPHLRGALCTSAAAAAELGELTGGKVPAAVVPLVIDEALYPVAEIDLDRRPGDPPRLLAVGRVAPHKRLEDVLAVHAILRRTFHPDLQLDIAGDTRLVPECHASLAAMAEPGVNWWGKVAFRHLVDLYRVADALLFTSAHEGFGVPLLEAMWMGVPVVAVHGAAAAETLGDGGLLVTQRHHAGMAELVELVLMDGRLRRRLRDQGRARAQAFAKATLSERLGAAWRQLA